MTKGKLTGLLIGAGLMAVCSAFSALAAGWETTDSGKYIYRNDDNSIVRNSWIRATEDGATVWYYATNNGSIRTDGWQKVNGQNYYFDEDGRMQTGWIDDNTYYCNDSGAMVTGWKQLTIPEEAVDSSDGKYMSGETGWFFFNLSNGEKYKSDDTNVKSKKINGTAYGFDEYGVMQTGWAKTSDTTPELAGYEYYAEKTDGKFSLGQRVQGTWYTTVGPEDSDGYGNGSSLATGDVEYFYFLPNGHPVVGGSEVCLVKKISGKIFLFNSYGNPATGLQYGSTTLSSSTADADVYYCGETKSNSSAATGKKFSITDDGGENITMQVLSNAKGLTGQKNGYLYYKGKLQKADSYARYQICIMDGEKYVVNASGLVMKNKKKLKDADGNRMNTDSSGHPTEVDGESFESFNASAPEIDTDSL